MCVADRKLNQKNDSLVYKTREILFIDFPFFCVIFVVFDDGVWVAPLLLRHIVVFDDGVWVAAFLLRHIVVFDDGVWLAALLLRHIAVFVSGICPFLYRCRLSANAEIKLPSSEMPELSKPLSFTPRIGWNVVLCVLPAAMKFTCNRSRLTGRLRLRAISLST